MCIKVVSQGMCLNVCCIHVPSSLVVGCTRVFFLCGLIFRGIKDALAYLGLQRCPIVRDGNCLFHAVCHAIGISPACKDQQEYLADADEIKKIRDGVKGVASHTTHTRMRKQYSNS